MYPSFVEPTVGSVSNKGQLPFGTLTDDKESRAFAGGGITTITGVPFSDAVNNKNANQFIHSIKGGEITDIESLKWNCNLRFSISKEDQIKLNGKIWHYYSKN